MHKSCLLNLFSQMKIAIVIAIICLALTQAQIYPNNFQIALDRNYGKCCH